jgi:hypothetical protein
MAITFEEKSSTGKTFASILVVLILLGGAGFFAWKYMIPEVSVPATTQPEKEKIDEKMLSDARLDDLELFPEVPPSAVPAGKLNPFSESTATATAETLEPIVAPIGE